MAFKKALVERALGAELTHHPGHRAGIQLPQSTGNHSNGHSAKTLKTLP
jgi:transposase-like protein